MAWAARQRPNSGYVTQDAMIRGRVVGCWRLPGLLLQLAVVGLAVVGLAVVGLAVVGLAVVGLAAHSCGYCAMVALLAGVRPPSGAGGWRGAGQLLLLPLLLLQLLLFLLLLLLLLRFGLIRGLLC
jgi:hypothetical protein